MIISSKEYETEIGDWFCNEAISTMERFFAEVAPKYGFESPSSETIEDIGYDFADIPELRDAFLIFAEHCGFSVYPDGSSF